MKTEATHVSSAVTDIASHPPGHDVQQNIETGIMESRMRDMVKEQLNDAEANYERAKRQVVEYRNKRDHLRRLYAQMSSN